VIPSSIDREKWSAPALRARLLVAVSIAICWARD
jgi:hypothetical protein